MGNIADVMEIQDEKYCIHGQYKRRVMLWILATNGMGDNADMGMLAKNMEFLTFSLTMLTISASVVTCSGRELRISSLMICHTTAMKD